MPNFRPDPDKNGKIPCDCCNHKGMRRRGGTNERYVCNYCDGTKLRTVPVGYVPSSQCPEVEEPALELINCPFCGDDDFDLIGLKNHLTSGYCEKFNETPTA